MAFVHPSIHPVVYGKGAMYRAYSNTADKNQVIETAYKTHRVPVDTDKAWTFFEQNQRLALDYGVLNIVVDVDAVKTSTKQLIAIEKQYKSVQKDSALAFTIKNQIIQLRTELGLSMGQFSEEPELEPVSTLPKRELVTYNDPDLDYDDDEIDDYEVRRTDSCQRAARYYDTMCSGCQELDAGTGGENQMAHMGPGGCLDEQEEDDAQVSRIISRSNTDYYFTDEGSTTPALWDFEEGRSFSRK